MTKSDQILNPNSRSPSHSEARRPCGPPTDTRGLPIVLYTNHASWWDPLVCLVLKAEFFADRAAFAPIDAAALPTNAPPRIELRDQYDAPQTLAFPTTNVTVLTIADKKGAEQIGGWINALQPNYAGRVELRGLADVGGAPGFVQDRIRKKFQETRKHPVMMDWSGKVCAQFGYKKDVANILVVGRDGVIRARFPGATNGAVLAKAHVALDQALALPTKVSPGSVPGSRAP